MAVTIIGSQFGDEGKDALVDLWGGDADIVVRYQGGDDAGHTIIEDGEKYKPSLAPGGAIRDKIGVLGNDCVINPRTLFSETDDPRERGLDPDMRLVKRAHVIMPYHHHLDNIEEETEADSDPTVGTTGHGIGPAYEDKAGRRGIRVGDLLNPNVLHQQLEYVVPQEKALVEDVYGLEVGEECDVEAFVKKYTEIGRRLREDGMAVNCGDFLAERREASDSVMFEGAQGTLIDIDHGSYPYVTSSSPITGGTATGAGVGPTVVGQGEVVGIVKSHLSRVNEGPMSTELGDGDRDEKLAEFIHEKGDKSDTATGRPRHIGWLDVPILRHAARISSFTGIAVNHLDALAGPGEVRVGHAYELEGEERLMMPATTERWGECEPVLKEFDTWPEVDWAAVAEKGYDTIPDATQDYLEYLSDKLDMSIYAVSVGPSRKQTVHIKNPFDD